MKQQNSVLQNWLFHYYPSTNQPAGSAVVKKTTLLPRLLEMSNHLVPKETEQEKPAYFSIKSTSTVFYFRFWVSFLQRCVATVKELVTPSKKDEKTETDHKESSSLFSTCIQFFTSHLMNIFLISVSMILIVILALLSWSIWHKFHLKRLLFAYYPIILYFLLRYGSQMLLALFVYFGPQKEEDQTSATSHKTKPVDSSYSFHIHLKSNLKRMLFRAFECSFYSAFFPFGFIPEYVFYDKFRCVISALYITFNTCFILYLQFCWHNRYKLMYHVRFVGGWEKIHSKSILAATYASSSPTTTTTTAMAASNSPSSSTHQEISEKNVEKLVSMADLSKIESEVQEWNKDLIPYGRASIVKWEGNMYLAMGEHNIENPTDFDSTILNRLYGRPDKAHATFVYFQALITITQLLFLNSTYWDSIILTLFFNYYIMYWCVGFWIEWKHLFNTFTMKKK